MLKLTEMRLSRSIGYFSQLRALLGLTAACRFAVAHLGNKLRPPRPGKLAHIPVGPYTFYFPSIDYFAGLFAEIFLNETYYLPQTQEPIRVIDCGANIGMSLLYIKIRAPRANVLCFEPNPAARAVLEKNIKENKWETEVKVLPYALGKEKGTVDFFVDAREATSSGGSTGHYQNSAHRNLNSYTVDVDILSRYVDHKVDLLKIDIEGGEFDVLEDLVARNKLHFVAGLQLEYHYFPGVTTRALSDMLVLLESGGFRTFAEPTALPHQVVEHDRAHAYMVFAWR